VIRDLVKALEGSVRAMYILSGHGANQALLKYAVRDLHDQCSVAILYGVLGVPPEVAEETESELWIGSYEHHSDEIETSLMLAVRPDLVRMDRAVSDYPPIPVDYGRSATSMGDLARTGVFGDATKASQEKGIRWLEALVEWHARQWREFLAHHQILVPP
jgi:creatinine amidohydrolase